MLFSELGLFCGGGFRLIIGMELVYGRFFWLIDLCKFWFIVSMFFYYCLLARYAGDFFSCLIVLEFSLFGVLFRLWI